MLKGRKRIAFYLVLVPAAIGMLFWWHWASQTVLRIKDFKTGHIYVEFPAKKGDTLFFGWIHSLEHIHWHEYFHIGADNTLILDTISFPAFGAGIGFGLMSLGAALLCIGIGMVLIACLPLLVKGVLAIGRGFLLGVKALFIRKGDNE